MMLILFIIQLLRGSGKEPSIIGATRCTDTDWILFSILLAASITMTIIAVVVQRKEYEHKKKIGYEFVPGDFKCTARNVIKLPIFGAIIGLITALSGIGPG